MIDSLSYVFRLLKEERERILCELCYRLSQLSADFDCAVVITNEITSRPAGNDNKFYEVAAMGDVWMSFLVRHIQMQRCDGCPGARRYLATIKKSPYMEESTVALTVSVVFLNCKKLYVKEGFSLDS